MERVEAEDCAEGLLFAMEPSDYAEAENRGRDRQYTTCISRRRSWG